MYLRFLQYLQAVIEHGSFAGAAKACGVSQPAISHGLKTLQAQFAQPLWVRHGRRYVPTDLARAVAAQGLPLARGLQALPQASPPPLDRHRLRVGLTSSAALVCGPLLYDGWCMPNARRTLEMVTADEGRLLAGLLEQRFDAVIAPKPRRFAHPDVVERLLYALHLRIYARRAHPLARATGLAQLQGAAWGCVGPSVSGPVDVLTEAHRVRRLPLPRMTVRCPDFASLMPLVVSRDLLVVVPHPVLLGTAASQVVALPLAEMLPLYSMWLFEPAHRPTRLPPDLFAPVG